MKEYHRMNRAIYTENTKQYNNENIIVGLLLNFNVVKLKDGIKRAINKYYVEK